MVEYKFVPVNSVKEGNVIDIEGSPCKVISVEKSKPGKHGAAKARIVGVDIFTDKKCTLLATGGDEVKSPIFQRSNAQFVADMGSTLQIMDLTTFETFELPKPTEKEILDRLENGCEVEYIRLEGQARILRVR